MPSVVGGRSCFCLAVVPSAYLRASASASNVPRRAFRRTELMLRMPGRRVVPASDQDNISITPAKACLTTSMFDVRHSTLGIVEPPIHERKFIMVRPMTDLWISNPRRRSHPWIRPRRVSRLRATYAAPLRRMFGFNRGAWFVPERRELPKERFNSRLNPATR